VSSTAAAPALVVVEDAYFSLKRLVVYAGLSERTLRTYLQHPLHPLPSYKIGGRVLVRRSEFDSWAARFRVGVSSAGVDAIVGDIIRGL
jgi:hypothetical protein